MHRRVRSIAASLNLEEVATGVHSSDELVRRITARAATNVVAGKRTFAVMLEGLDYIAPPTAPGQPSLPFHLMILSAVNKYGMQNWLRQKAVTALLVEGYGENRDSWFLHHALETRTRARG